MRRIIVAAGIVSVVLVSACGGKSSSSPTTPTAPSTSTPTTPANRAPSITAMSITPAFGIAQLTQFSFSGSASDPDGDAVTFAWDVAGNPFSGTSGTITFSNGGNGTATLTVTDSHGATATDSRTFVVGSMTGKWSGTIPGYTDLSFDLSQSGAVVTGTFSDQYFGPGKIDPAQTGRIDTNGNIEMRFKLAYFTDFTFRGQMDATGRRITGGVFGSGFTGQPFRMTKQ